MCPNGNPDFNVFVQLYIFVIDTRTFKPRLRTGNLRTLNKYVVIESFRARTYVRTVQTEIRM